MNTREPGTEGEDSPRSTALMVAEYAGLRDEVTKRIEIQHQILSITLVTAAAFLGLGSQTALPVPGAALPVPGAALLLYPLLAVFLAIAWEHNGARILNIGGYFRYREGRSGGGLEWEKYLQDKVGTSPVGSITAARGLFVMTQLLAIGLAAATSGLAKDLLPLVNQQFLDGVLKISAQDIAYSFFLVLDLGVTVYTAWVVGSIGRRSKE